MLEGMFMFAMTEWWPFSEYVRTVMLVIYHSIPLCVYCDPAIMIFFLLPGDNLGQHGEQRQ